MNALEWIQQFENYLALVKNRANNTVRGYVADAEFLQRFFKLEDWGAFTEEMAVEYVREIKKTAADTSVARKIYSLRQLFKFLQEKECYRRGSLRRHGTPRHPPKASDYPDHRRNESTPNPH